MNTAENIMQNLALKMPKAFDWPKVGEVVEGRVMKKSAKNLYIDLGIWGIGIVYGIEFINAQDIIKNLKVGASVFAKIVEVQNESGFRELSLAEAKAQKSWDLIRELKKTNQAITTKILSVNRGGLIVEISGIAGFLPVSQLASEHYPRVEGGDKNKILEELSKFVGLEFKIRVLDFDVKENKLIVSERAAEEEHLKRAIERYKIGDIISGSVSGVVDWGVFVKWPARQSLTLQASAGGAMEEEMLEGLIHISELDWQLVENPADLVKVGDEVAAQIIDIANDRISLSLKRLKIDPWKTASELLEKGMLIEGLVKKFNPFGAFVEIVCHPNECLQGLCHISEFGSDEKMNAALEVGKKYQFKILAFVPEEHRMSLGVIL
ncbi:MAG TPA: S1 RNA-binding domain-containing protein [Candidatus Paceibacterota bacterium]